MLALLTGFYLWGVAKIPFHPDESTQLYMSADFDQLFKNPLNMIWKPENPISQEMRYRQLDAPLTRYLLGFGRHLFGVPPLTSDWDWSASWENNQQAGSLPDVQLLLIGRFSVALLFPLALLLLYLIGIAFQGRLLGVIAVFIFGTNALVLLHTRRAMAEGPLVFSLLLALYLLTLADKRPFLAGLAVALAVSAKQSSVILLPIGIIAACWLPSRNLKRMAMNLGSYLAGFALLTLLLNPFLWKHPVSASFEALRQRQNLVDRQVASHPQSQVLKFPFERLAVIAAQLSIAPPIFSEVGNYQFETAPQEADYVEIPGHKFWRSPPSAGLLLGFFFLGLIAAVRNIFNADHKISRQNFILVLTLFAVFVFTLVAVPLAWQRYYLPMIPIYSLLSGLGVVWGIKSSRRLVANGSISKHLSEILSQFAPNSRMS